MLPDDQVVGAACSHRRTTPDQPHAQRPRTRPVRQARCRQVATATFASSATRPPAASCALFKNPGNDASTRSSSHGSLKLQVAFPTSGCPSSASAAIGDALQNGNLPPSYMELARPHSLGPLSPGMVSQARIRQNPSPLRVFSPWPPASLLPRCELDI